VRSDGRQAEADRNDQRVLVAAREVFAEYGADAPMSAIAKRAQVGQGTLYRRYASKEELIQQLCVASTAEAAQEADAALAAEPDAWSALTRFTQRCAQIGFGAFGNVAGRFTVTPELLAAVERMRAAVDRLVARAHAEGSLRSDVSTADICLIFARLHGHRPGAGWNRDFGPRYVALVLAGLRAPGAGPLPGQPMTWDDVTRPWLS
jgi:AcrR family transcriptional regulator